MCSVAAQHWAAATHHTRLYVYEVGGVYWGGRGGREEALIRSVFDAWGIQAATTSERRGKPRSLIITVMANRRHADRLPISFTGSAWRFSRLHLLWRSKSVHKYSRRLIFFAIVRSGGCTGLLHATRYCSSSRASAPARNGILAPYGYVMRNKIKCFIDWYGGIVFSSYVHLHLSGFDPIAC